MQTIRKAAVAGQFYPDSTNDLRREITTFLNQALADDRAREKPAILQPKAIIVPHAGYMYSGSTAADGFSHLFPFKDTIKRVVLLGPSHRVGFTGIASSSATFFQTPLGDIPLDQEANKQLLSLHQVHEIDQAHEFEHSLEVQLPFLQTLLSDFKLIPLVVGDADSHTVSQVLEALWGNEETLFVISSDLSHYLDYQSAIEQDASTCRAIESCSPESIKDEDACGRNPIKGLLVSARKHKLSIKTVTLRNSGDTAGDKQRVVGYGAWVLC